MMNRCPSRAAALGGALIAIAGIAALAGLAACSPPGGDGGSTSHTVTQSPQEVASYWTDDRMASAKPAHMPEEP
ncbi:hypothetical protein AM609_06085 [Actinomyces sp. oral taxon 414]|uniref:hypothetical protein n=1 Tax=Actinomyces sp. oral taxon 414 TaxID=712122 RepID=UPI0006B010A6|nr:hypothetical protein [Actinomyces sp. oral taxon 414]ALC99157.1 hypothetical protein AM609_06085 [Actinomyces sp. oral taxon 414]